MSGVNFYLSEEDLDRLFYLKAKGAFKQSFILKCPRVPERRDRGLYNRVIKRERSTWK